MINENTVGMVAAIGTPLGLVLVAGINYWTSIRAAKDARAAQEAAVRAQMATQAAADASRVSEEHQLALAKVTHGQLNEIADTTHVIHTIVNSQHTKLIHLIAHLTARVAQDNPKDVQAQFDAKEAAAAVDDILKGSSANNATVADTDLSKA